MKQLHLTTMVFLFFLFSGNTVLSQSQDTVIHPSFIGNGVFLGLTPPLRDLPALTPSEIEALKERALIKAANKKPELRHYPFAGTALPKGPDQAWQNFMGETDGPKAPLVNFEGQSTSSYPPDCNGTVGPNHFMQTVNVTYSIYNKTGTLLAGPTALNTLFTGVPGATQNDGDPIVLYDEQADRWFVAEFTFNLSNDYMLMAVSTTNDPTGTWYKYSFDVTNDPDYPKFGVWQDGYYMGINSGSGNDTYVFERSKMLLGQTAQMVGFDNSWRPGPVNDFLCVPPLDNDDAAAPAGAPGMFIAFNDDAVGGGSDQLWIYELAVNWTTPSASTFTRTQQLNVTAFDSQFTSTWDDITQPTSQKLDGVPQVIMNAPQYRNFGTYQTIVCCHTVDVDATNHAGIRWYELRKTPPETTWTIRQQSTYAPDAASRWMGSIMLNSSGKLGLGYSISSSTIYPGIRYCGQSASAYAAASGVLDIPEDVIHAGTVAQITYNRWGDYALLSVDPADDQTFWFTTEYVKTGGSTKGSKIASFKFGNAPAVTTLAATSITGTTATINGSVNPSGFATTYYFQWGTSTNYGYNTTTTSAGSGTQSVAVNANLTGLVSGTTYHFRLVATNSDGTSNGNDLTFTPGAAIVTTTAVTAIAQNTATSGGNVTTDGGVAVTARGVCWATTANPTISGSHTTDGAGTGTFTSSITGLSSNTLYHVRAFATNASGTYYGEDLPFTTLCGVISSFPWNEGFENAGVIPSCWIQEQVNSSGVNWIFTTGNGASNPPTAHGGTYNACLKDNTTADNKTRLITPSLNLSSLQSPQLKFWHTQQLGTSSTRQDQLYVYYRTSATGAWTLLASYTNSIVSWTQETLTLPNPTSDYYINFEGNAKRGYGVCIDDVSISTSCASYLPVSVSIAASVNPVCAGTSVTFTPTPVNGGTPTYQWFKNSVSVGTSSTYSYVPVTGDQVYVIMTSSLSCTTGNPATSNTVIMAVNPTLPVSVSVVPSENPVIAGTSVTFTATPANGGTTPVYQWKVNGTNAGTNSPAYTYIPVNNDAVICVLTSNATCATGNPATSNTVTMIVNPRTLAVDPSNRDVTAAPGMTTFNVTSNSNWTVSSDQLWCVVDLSGSGNGTLHANYTENTAATPRIANITVIVTGLTPVVVTVTQAGAPYKVLNLKVYLEGLYNTLTGTMNEAMDIGPAPEFGPGVADMVTVELHNATNYTIIEYTSGPVLLSTSGEVSISTIPANFSGSYYITIRHRNSIETTSAQPVSFTGGTINYDFSTASSQAHGDNLLDMNGVFVIYCGDVNQDGLVNPDDMVLIEFDSDGMVTGYITTDINGDALIDISDMILVDHNASQSISSLIP